MAAFMMISLAVAQDEPKPGRLRIPQTRKLEMMLNTKDRAIVWRTVDFGAAENQALKSDGTKVQGEMNLSLVYARYADAEKSEVRGIRMAFDCKEKGAVVASRVVVMDPEEVEELTGVLEKIVAMGKEPKGEIVDYHVSGGVTFRGVMSAKQPVFQVCLTPEAGRVGSGEFCHEPPVLAAGFRDILKGALAKLKE